MKKVVATNFLALGISLSTVLHLNAQTNCVDVAIPTGSSNVVMRGHSTAGPRCFEFTPGDGRAGVIEIVEGNATMSIEAVTVGVTRYQFSPGPWTYYIDVLPEPMGGAGGPFSIRFSSR